VKCAGGFQLASSFQIKESVATKRRVGGNGVANIVDFQWFRDTGEIISPTDLENELLEALPTLDEMATVMTMSSDELFLELLARVEYGESLRESVSTSSLISELTNRVLHMELLCEVATQIQE